MHSKYVSPSPGLNNKYVCWRLYHIINAPWHMSKTSLCPVTLRQKLGHSGKLTWSIWLLCEWFGWQRHNYLLVRLKSSTNSVGWQVCMNQIKICDWDMVEGRLNNVNKDFGLCLGNYFSRNSFLCKVTTEFSLRWDVYRGSQAMRACTLLWEIFFFYFTIMNSSL